MPLVAIPHTATAAPPALSAARRCRAVSMSARSFAAYTVSDGTQAASSRPARAGRRRRGPRSSDTATRTRRGCRAARSRRARTRSAGSTRGNSCSARSRNPRTRRGARSNPGPALRQRAARPGDRRSRRAAPARMPPDPACARARAGTTKSDGAASSCDAVEDALDQPHPAAGVHLVARQRRVHAERPALRPHPRQRLQERAVAAADVHHVAAREVVLLGRGTRRSRRSSAPSPPTAPRCRSCRRR